MHVTVSTVDPRPTSDGGEPLQSLMTYKFLLNFGITKLSLHEMWQIFGLTMI